MPRKSRRLPGGRVRKPSRRGPRRGRRAAARRAVQAAPTTSREEAAPPVAVAPPLATKRAHTRAPERRASARGRLSPLDRAAANLTYIRADLIRIAVISVALLAVLIVLTIMLR